MDAAPLGVVATRIVGLEGLLAPGAQLERVATGATWGEGPVWLPTLRALRWSDIPGDRILQFDAATGATSVHREQVEFTNGRVLSADGSVVQCSHGLRRLERETAGPDGPVVTALADHWRGVRLNSPNDVVEKRDGTLWFSDPPYGITQPDEGHPGEREYGDCYVFRLDPRTGDLAPVVIDLFCPNGLAFSPDETVLYVSDTAASYDLAGDGNRCIRAYDVVDGALCKNGRTFAELPDGLSDGFRVDVAGRVWSSTLDGVVVYAPDGALLGKLPVPEKVANVCFGGDDGSELYITASTSLYRVRTSTVGATAALAAPAGGRA